MNLRALALLACAVPAVALAEPQPRTVTPSYVPRVHPPGPGASPDDAGNPGYFYVSYGQEVVLSGAGAMITQAAPQVSTIDFHSLAEIAVESDDGQQIIEIGWTIDPGVNPGSVDPHLFSFHWIDGVGTCYNACGWVQVSTEHAPGDRVAADTAPHSFQIEHRADARWWLTYDGDDMGYYPDTEWQGRYTAGGFTQWFGEIAAGTESEPCTQMGDAIKGGSAGAAAFTNIYRLVNGAQVAASVQKTAITLPEAYISGNVTPSSFEFGGPGVTSATCQYFVDTPDASPAVEGPPSGDVGNGEDGGGAGCCDAGRDSGGGALLGAGIVAAVLRRRRGAI